MFREKCEPRDNWQAKVEELGLIWHTANGAPYWTEDACYVFSNDEIAALETATSELYQMYIAAGQYIVDNNLYGLFGIPQEFWQPITDSWNSEPPALNYGRFDLGFDGKDIKLFEFNCDTPTSLLEASVIQWAWMEDKCNPHIDQWNSIHDKLVAKWKDIRPYLNSNAVHFAHISDDAGEDSITTAYLADTANAAGLRAIPILLKDIGWDGYVFRDMDNEVIDTIYKLYPWEWMVNEEFGLPSVNSTTLWIEPIWKMIWSNKAILPILWDLYPRNRYLLWASRTEPSPDMSYVKKPILAREGSNIEIVRSGQVVAETQGAYSESEVIYQGLYNLPKFDGAYPVIGSWIVDGEPAGMGIREDGLITGNLARFVPHIIR